LASLFRVFEEPGEPLQLEAAMHATPLVTRCECGHDKRHPAVRPVKRYGVTAAMLLLMGYTALPRRIEISCATCGAVFDTITDRGELAKFRYDMPGIYER
jgi:hypothetical protein